MSIFTLHVTNICNYSIHDIERGYYADGEDAYDMRHPFVTPPAEGSGAAGLADAMKGLSINESLGDGGIDTEADASPQGT